MTNETKPDMYYFCADQPVDADRVTIGGLAMTARTLETLTEALKAPAKSKAINWDNLTKTNLKTATEYLTEFCRLMSENKSQLHLRFTSTLQVDVINKMELTDNVKTAHLYYHLILQRAFRFYGEKYEIHIRPKNPIVPKVLGGMRVRMHKDSFDLYGFRHDPVTSLEMPTAGQSPIIQMLSLALGAITAIRHKIKESELSTEQHILITTLQKNLSIPILYSNSGSLEQKFSIWNDEPGLEHTGFRGLL